MPINSCFSRAELESAASRSGFSPLWARQRDRRERMAAAERDGPTFIRSLKREMATTRYAACTSPTACQTKSSMDGKLGRSGLDI